MLFDDTYQSVKNPGEGDFRDRGSKFLAYAYPVKNESEIKVLLEKAVKEHPQANHHCYAYRLTPDASVFRVNDDGEPAGSAGRPILNAVLSKQLTNVLVIVVRYFGGTLLGVPGLIHAYRTVATEALTNAGIVEHIITEEFRIECGFDHSNAVHQLIRQFNAKIISQEYTEPVVFVISVRKTKVNEFEQKFKNHPVLGHQATLTPILL